MPMRYSVTAGEIHTATCATIAALESLNLKCCLVGSVACSAYGMSRVPNDIDMVVFTSEYTQEELKDRLVRYDTRFYLMASKDRFATYRILWFRLDGFHRSCKIDLLLPGIMNIPSVAPQRIHRIGREGGATNGNYLSLLATDYPLMPFLPLLLLKLQAWQDHGESTKIYMRTKQPTDVQDIRELLQLAERKYAVNTSTRNVRYDNTQSLLDREKPYLPVSFVRDANVRVRKFTTLHPWSAKQWKLIGFEVETGVRGNVSDLESMMRSLAVEDQWLDY